MAGTNTADVQLHALPQQRDLLRIQTHLRAAVRYERKYADLPIANRAMERRHTTVDVQLPSANRSLCGGVSDANWFGRSDGFQQANQSPRKAKAKNPKIVAGGRGRCCEMKISAVMSTALAPIASSALHQQS